MPIVERLHQVTIKKEIESFNNACYQSIKFNKGEDGYPKSRTVFFVATKFAAEGVSRVLENEYGLSLEHIDGNKYSVTWDINHKIKKPFN